MYGDDSLVVNHRQLMLKAGIKCVCDENQTAVMKPPHKRKKYIIQINNSNDEEQTADKSKAQPQTASEIEQLHSADVNSDITPSNQPSGTEIDQNVDTVKNGAAHHISDEAISRSVHIKMK